MAIRAALNGNSVAPANGGRARCVASWPAARHLIGDPGAHEELDGGRGDREDGDRSDVVWLSPFFGSPRSAVFGTLAGFDALLAGASPAAGGSGWGPTGRLPGGPGVAAGPARP